MSGAQFTPGPHEAEPSDHLGAHAYAIKAGDGDYLAVGCTLWDAYLFAAAPELYEALEATRRAFCGIKFNDEQLAAYNVGSEAIRKARGDQ